MPCRVQGDGLRFQGAGKNKNIVNLPNPLTLSGCPKKVQKCKILSNIEEKESWVQARYAASKSSIVGCQTEKSEVLNRSWNMFQQDVIS